MGQNCQTNLEEGGFILHLSQKHLLEQESHCSVIAYGVRGTEVDPDEKQDPVVIIEGGGGVGAVGKAIFGEDGSFFISE